MASKSGLLAPLLLLVLCLLPGIDAANCASGWTAFDSDCYFIVQAEQSWSGCKTMCDSLGGSLAEIYNWKIQQFITNLLGRIGHGMYWFGLTDVVIENDFVWTNTKKTANYTNWRDGEPNNNQNGEACAEMWIGGGWNDEHCVKPRGCVCKMPGRRPGKSG